MSSEDRLGAAASLELDDQPEIVIDAAADEGADIEISRRASAALSDARLSIVSDLRSGASTAAAGANAGAPPRIESRRDRRSVDRWQSSENIFNLLSRSVHTRLTEKGRFLTSSMSSRISLRYIRVLWRAAAVAALISLIFVLWAENTAITKLTRDITYQLTENAERGDGMLETGFEPTLSTLESAYVFIADGGGDIVFSSLPFDIGYTNFAGFDGQLYRIDASLCAANGHMYQLYVALSLRYWLRMALYIILCITAFVLVVSAYLLLNSRAINASTIRPIVDMSDTARHLSVNDLSQRLNVAGTRSELRELAMVINDMLDRIESSYNAQRQFVSDASHELRTPIAVIEGYANMLKRWGNDDPQVREEASDAIARESANMKELVEKLLFLARHDNKTTSMRMEPVDMLALTQEAISETRMIVGDKTIAEGMLEPVTVLGDTSALKQAIRIFIDNACKYTSAGGTITISCRRGGEGCLISVADTGCGIPAAELDRIFDRFYRVDDSRGEIPGHGLGLSIARIIAVNHGGRIHVRSKEGAGSVFTLELPGWSGG